MLLWMAWRHCYLWLSGIPLCVCVFVCVCVCDFFIHSSVNGQRFLPCSDYYIYHSSVLWGSMYLFKLWFSPDMCPGVGSLNPTVVLLLVFIYLCFLKSFHTVLQGFPGGSNCKESACKARDLSWKDPLEKDMATHFSILTWRIPWTEGPDGLQIHGVTKSWTWLSN